MWWKHGSSIKIENESAVVLNTDNSNVYVEGNELQIKTSGRFKATISINGKSDDYEFFAWNAYIKNGKYWTYTDSARHTKAAVLHSKVYLSLSKVDSSFKVEDFLFNGGKYSKDLVGKYLTSYYDFKKHKSTTNNYEYSLEDSSILRPTEVYVESISLTKDAATVVEGASITLEAKVMPNNSSNKNITWATSDESIAKVNSKGKVTAIKQGTAVITASSSNGKTAQCTITVIQKTTIIKAKKIILDKTNMNIDVVSGNYGANEYKLKLNATIEPENTTDKTIIWKSGNSKIATVEDGIVTPVSKGTVRITAYTSNGKKATCTIKINNIVPPKVSSIKLNAESRKVIVGNTLQITSEILPSNATDKSLAWTSSDEKIATVNDGIVTGLNLGVATIIAKNIDSGIEARMAIEVVSETSTVESSDKLEVHFISAGRVDAIYIKVGDKSIFVDGGFDRSATGSIIPYLNKIGVEHIDYYIGTHGHKDHVEAAPRMIEKYSISTIICGNNKYKGSISTLNQIKRFCKTEAQKKAVNACNVITIGNGDVLDINDLTIRCIGPIKFNLKANPKSSKAGPENGNSLVLRLEYADYSMLLTGDNSITSNWKAIAKEYPELVKADIYKNAHHNGNTSAIVKIVQPKYVLFLTTDKYLPASTFLKTIKEQGAKYYIGTPKKDGNIILTIDADNGIQFKTKQ